MQVQSITYVRIDAVTMQIPWTTTAQTHPQTVEDGLHCYSTRAHDEMQYNGGTFPFTMLQPFATAAPDSGAICCMYTNEKGETRARSLFPPAIRLTDDRKIAVNAYDSVCAAPCSFRIDRCAGYHLVTFPGAVADDEPRGDGKDSIAG